MGLIKRWDRGREQRDKVEILGKSPGNWSFIRFAGMGSPCTFMQLVMFEGVTKIDESFLSQLKHI
ncbi:unnamed protein product [Fusarium graminearum]|nr:unnamed protein product [Fusarium graminearum]